MSPYTPFNTDKVALGPSTLYAAKLGSTEPTSATGDWDVAWVKLGLTSGGSTFTTTQASDTVEVDEELDPARVVLNNRTTTFAFNLAENTARNLLLQLNAGLLGSGELDTNPDGSINVEPPDGDEVQRIMLGWDSKASGTTPTDPSGRLIIRQALQTGDLTLVNQKGNTPRTFSGTFTAEKPATAKPFRFIFPADRAGL